MNAPHNSLFDMPLAMFEMSTMAFTGAARFWVRLAERQMQMLGTPRDERRSHVEIAHGATFLDHYGRRMHDIDPEHDV